MVSRTLEKAEIAIPVQKDPDILAAAARLSGEDMCSIADLTTFELAGILELAHDVKTNPAAYRWALDAKQMVMFFEKASLRTRLTFQTAMNTLGGTGLWDDTDGFYYDQVSLLKGDPFHANGIFVKWVIRPWNVVMGNPALMPK